MARLLPHIFASWLLLASLLPAQCWNGQCMPAAPVWRAAPRQVTPPPPSNQPPHPAVVRIVNQRSQSQAFGSGTLIETEHGPLVATCDHIFHEGVGQILVLWPGGTPIPAEVVARETSAVADLSLLRLAGDPPVRGVELAPQPPIKGDPSVSAGFGSDGQYRANSGRVNGYTALDGRTMDIMEISGPSRKGDSGGPVFNDRGELAGVLFGSDMRTCTSATHCGTIRRLLRSIVGRPPNRPAQQPPAGQAPRFEPRDSAWNERVRTLEAEVVALGKRVDAAGCRCEPHRYVTKAYLSALATKDELAGLRATLTNDNFLNKREVAKVEEKHSKLLDIVRDNVEISKLLSGRITQVLLGLGVPTFGATALTWLVMWRLRKRVKQFTERDAAPVGATVAPAASSARPVVIHSQSPPPPQVVERSREFVQVETPSKRLTALQRAMDEYVRRNPGARGTIETIEAFADQYQSGDKL